MDPNDIRYTQDSIKSTFKDGRSVDNMIDGLKSGKLTKGDVKPIRVFKENGKIFSLDNRRLYAFKEAGMKEINVVWVNKANPKIASIISKHLTTINEGLSILIR